MSDTIKHYVTLRRTVVQTCEVAVDAEDTHEATRLVMQQCPPPDTEWATKSTTTEALSAVPWHMRPRYR